MARRHVADAGAVTLNIVIHEVEETGESIARHPHEFERERGWCQHPSEPPGIRVRGDVRPYGNRSHGGRGGDNEVPLDNQRKIVNIK